MVYNSKPQNNRNPANSHNADTGVSSIVWASISNSSVTRYTNAAAPNDKMAAMMVGDASFKK